MAEWYSVFYGMILTILFVVLAFFILSIISKFDELKTDEEEMAKFKKRLGIRSPSALQNGYEFKIDEINAEGDHIPVVHGNFHFEFREKEDEKDETNHIN